MKKNNILMFIGAVLLLFATSCSDFLDQEPESKPSPEAIFKDPKATNAYVLGLYKQWRDCHKPRSDYYLGTDEIKLGGVQYRDNQNRRGIELYNNELSSTNGIALDLWKSRFELAAGATLAIDNLVAKEESNEDMALYLGEAYAMRAACYFELVQNYGEIPLKNSEVVAESGSKRQPLSVVYAKIESDLLNAIRLLPEPLDSKYTDKRRFSKAFAHAMLGKTYLYALDGSNFRDYEKAAEQFKIVYENPAFGRTGASKPSVIFDYTGKTDNTAEYEMEMVYAFRFSNVRDDNSGAQWDVGSRAVAIMTDDEATIYFAGFDAVMPTAYCYSTVAEGGIWEPGDYRKEVSIRYDFTYKGRTPVISGYCYGDELDPHIKKYEDHRTEDLGLNTWHSGKNIPYIRFADVVLCYGECLYFSGKQADGIKLINEKIRARAFQSRPSGSNMWPTNLDSEEFMKRLMDERMRELCFEGWRRMDLIRTGKVKEYVPKRNSWFLEKGFTTVDEDRYRFPIPLDELRMNPDLTDEDQNNGY